MVQNLIAVCGQPAPAIVPLLREICHLIFSSYVTLLNALPLFFRDEEPGFSVLFVFVLFFIQKRIAHSRSAPGWICWREGTLLPYIFQLSHRSWLSGRNHIHNIHAFHRMILRVTFTFFKRLLCEIPCPFYTAYLQRWSFATFFWVLNRNSSTWRKHFRYRNSATFKEMLLRNHNSAIPQSQFFLKSATSSPQL